MVVVVLVVKGRLALELLTHVVSILIVGVVLGLDVVNLVAECLGTKIEGGAVTLPHVEGDVLGSMADWARLLFLTRLLFLMWSELGGEAELAVGAEDGEGGDVAVALGGVLLHLGEDVADDTGVVVLGRRY